MNVLSTSLFRHPKARPGRAAYVRHLPLFLRAAAAWFSGWQVRIHCDFASMNCDYGQVLQSLQETGFVKLVDCGPSPSELREGKLWRILPCWDPDVRVVAARDADSTPTPRDRAMVDEFLMGSWPGDPAIHTVHDYAQHSGIMAGLSTYKAYLVRERVPLTFPEFLSSARLATDLYGFPLGDDAGYSDQNALNQVLVPLVGAPLVSARVRRSDADLQAPWLEACPAGGPRDLALVCNMLAGMAGSRCDVQAGVEFYDASRGKFPDQGVRDRLSEIVVAEERADYDPSKNLSEEA